MSLDDELLMLAGEDDEDTKISSPPRRKRSSPPTSASPAKKRSRPTTKKPSKKKTKKEDSDDDDDEDEDSSSALSEAPSSEISSQSEADEAMDLASSSDEEDSVQDLYPLEGKYKDQADMQKLLAMEEIDREAVLAERAAQIERAQQDRHLRNLLKSRNAADKANGLAAGGSSTRRSARTKSMPKKNEETTKRGKLEELKKTREERSTRAAGSGRLDRGDDDGPKRRSIADEDEEKAGFAEDLYIGSKEEREIQVSDVNRARIGRTGLGKLCDYPGFEEAVRDCFVRVSLYDREKETNAYRIGQIKGFVVGKPYTMLDGKRRTDQHVRISHGVSEKSFAMEFLSDSPMTEAEFIRYKKTLEYEKVALPSLSFVERKAQDIRALDSRTLTPEEVDAMIAKRNKDKIDPVKVVLARSNLRKAREIAVTKGDEAEILRIDKELQDLEDSKGRSHARADSQMDRLARLNAENRKRNIAELRKAELDEKRAARRAAEEAERSGKMSNPFMRVRTKARLMHGTVEVRQDKDDPEAKSGSQDGTTSDTPKGVGLIGNGAIKKGRRMGGVDDVIASLDFGIDIEI